MLSVSRRRRCEKSLEKILADLKKIFGISVRGAVIVAFAVVGAGNPKSLNLICEK